jgi:hypothetical protein
MRITFEVDQVARERKRARERPVAEVLGEFAGREVIVWSGPEGAVIEEPRCHPFAGAVHLAFSEHRPLILSPDAAWLTIAQGFAQHVNQDPKSVRDRLVPHTGTRTVTSGARRLVTREDWAGAIDGLCSQVRREAPGVSEWLRNDFSTSTSTTRVAGDVVLLDTLKRYFRYRMMFICGIPEVTLLGNADDWRKIEARVERLADYDLEWWTDLLLPVCRELRRSAEGDPDLDFWQSIYMPEEVYGGEEVTGWLMRFFPYIDLMEQRDVLQEGPIEDLRAFMEASSESPAVATRNPGLAPWTERKTDRWQRKPAPTLSEPRRRWLCEGISLKRLPLGVSAAPVEIVGPTGDAVGKIQLLSGFVGVSQNDSLAVQAEIAWAVVEGGDELVRMEDWR